MNCRELQDFLTLRQRVPHLSRPDASEPVGAFETPLNAFDSDDSYPPQALFKMMIMDIYEINIQGPFYKGHTFR